MSRQVGRRAAMKPLTWVKKRPATPSEVRTLHQDAVAQKRATLGAEHPDFLIASNDFAVLLWDQGDVSAARALYEEVLGTARHALGPTHIVTLRTANNLGLLRKVEGDRDAQRREDHYAAARALLEEALAGKRETLGVRPRPDKLADLSTSLTNLALLLKAQQNELGAARRLYIEALATRRAALGDRHADTIASMVNLAWVLSDEGELAEAQALFDEASRGYKHPAPVQERPCHDSPGGPASPGSPGSPGDDDDEEEEPVSSSPLSCPVSSPS
jgi:tetratricopeptide (TPR) repeat protein